MALERDDIRVEEIRVALGETHGWPRHDKFDSQWLYHDFTSYLAKNLGQRPIKLVTLDSSTDETSASIQAAFFMDGLIARCEATIADLQSHTGMGRFTSISPIRIVSWSSIQAVSSTPHLNESADLSKAVDFDIEMSDSVIEVRHAGHRVPDKASALYADLLEHLANRR